ncbi:hypothetical protein [Kitasatospora kifunensis]|uniref:Uncharacterized protein n=1 Tax=Kitasatospora kifunensis TaxID=58351 RepID=A0A7W7R8I4_KITKI|nr:hypothetical protein [Kitasatospora kifunensis]MBB4927378.1 hypothetical protein [Kitasatospora kifunensis]
MHELEYGTVVLRFGRDLPPGTSKVYCKGITVKVRTGASGTDLTVEPSLITTAVSKVDGEAQGTEWWVDRDTTDPNEAVFSFVPDTTAVFDGTWAVSLTLSGIEVNSSIGTVTLDIEELTSTTGAEGSYLKRTGEVKVQKGNDEFFFRSLHPRTVVINRGSTVDLLWEAPADNRITYTMYYRKADGSETSDSVQANFAGRVWKSPALDDNANFTLKATLDGRDYFLTTSLTVNTPNVVVNALTVKSTLAAESTVSASGLVSANGGVTVPSGKVVSANGGVSATTVSASGLVSANGGVSATTVSASGLVSANGGVTVPSGKVVSANGGVSATTVSASGLVSANGGVSATTVSASGLVSANGGVTVAAGKTLTVNGPLAANDGLTMAAGKNITIPLGGGELVVADAFLAKSHKSNVNWPKVEVGPTGIKTEGNIIVSGSPIFVQNVNYGVRLNATVKIGSGGAAGWKATAYWGNTTDGDNNLTIHKR